MKFIKNNNNYENVIQLISYKRYLECTLVQWGLSNLCDYKRVMMTMMMKM